MSIETLAVYISQCFSYSIAFHLRVTTASSYKASYARFFGERFKRGS